MSNQISPTTDPTLLASVALTSFAALLLELALTRLFSVVLFYHFAFLAISIALLGLGAGGVFAYIARGWLRQFETRHLASQLCTMPTLDTVVVRTSSKEDHWCTKRTAEMNSRTPPAQSA